MVPPKLVGTQSPANPEEPLQLRSGEASRLSGYVPVFIVTGFLGSGKTTLLRRLLRGTVGERSAVFVNEFGEVGLDHHLIKGLDEDAVLIGGGCVCCTRRNDLVKALRELLDDLERGRAPQVDRVIIETTGLADPAPIMFTILTDPVLQHHFRIERVVVTVDAVNGQLHLDRHDQSVKQVVVADDLIITKVDLVGGEQVEALASRLRRLSPSARISTAVYGEIDLEEFFTPRERQVDPLAIQQLNGQSGGEGSIRSISLSFDGPLDWAAFTIWLSMLLHARGEDVLRVKGMLDVGDSGPVVLNGVQHIIHPPEHLPEWPGEEVRSHLVFIVKDIDPREIARSLELFQSLLGVRTQIHQAETLK